MMAAPVFQANGSAQISAGAITVAWPTHQVNDLAILAVQTSNEAVTLSTPAGFVALGTPTGIGTAGAAGAVRLTLFYAFATSSSMASPVVADSGDHQIGVITTYRGVYIGGAPEVGGHGVATTSTSVSVPGGTTSTNDCLIAVYTAHAIDVNGAHVSGQANATLTSLAEVFDNATNTGTGGGFAVDTGILATEGAYAATTATLDTTSAQELYSVILASLAEAPATDTTPPEIVDFGPTPITPSSPITWRVTDETGLRSVVVLASFPASGIDAECVYDSERFRGLYRNASGTETGSATDKTFTALRSGGWPSTPVLEYVVTDTSGNVGVLG